LIDENKKKETVKPHTVWVCPGCGSTVHADRRYCDCHADLSNARARLTEKPADAGRCNFETSGLCCNDCPENCGWCASFGSPVSNSRGFGGKDCRGYSGTARCYCCRYQVKLALKIAGEGFFRIMGDAALKKDDVTANPLKTLSNVIRAEMEKPVLARINHAMGKAG
jgi:hypothetical protein